MTPPPSSPAFVLGVLISRHRWPSAILLAVFLLAALILFRWKQSLHTHAGPFAFNFGQSRVAFINIDGGEHFQITSDWPNTVPPNCRLVYRSGYSEPSSGIRWQFGPITFWDEDGSQLAVGPVKYWKLRAFADGWDPVRNVEVPGGMIWFRSLDIPHRILLPLSLTPALVIAGLSVRRLMAQRRRHRAGLCITCSYDLRAHRETPGGSPGLALPPRCPECGTPIPVLPGNTIPP